ncbi:MAG: glycerophosphoryl diester phosphodiesterase [Luteibaculaceae bacterium]
MEEAFKRGIKYAEVDANKTANNIRVLIHDTPHAARTSSTTLSILNTNFQTLKTFDYGSWKGPAFSGTPLPTLEEALLLEEQYDAFLHLDTKSFTPQLFQEVLVEKGVNPNRLMPAINSFAEADSFRTYCPNSPFVFFGDWRDHLDDTPWFQTRVDKGCIAF